MSSVPHPMLTNEFLSTLDGEEEKYKIEKDKALAQFLKKKDKEKIRLTLKHIEEEKKHEY